jgi:AraC-like DNA-binding protein
LAGRWTKGGVVRQNRTVNRVTPLLETPAVLLERFSHEPGIAHRDPERERARGYAVNFIEHGSFRLRLGKTWRRLSPASLFAATPGLEFSCAHDEDHPSDQCLSVRYAEAAIESLRSAGAAAVAGSVRALTNRQAFLRLELLADAPDAAGTEAIAGALYWSLAGPEAARPLFRPGQLSWYAARVARVKALIRAHSAEPLSLSRMAREAGMSVYHFARVFAELEGQPPHKYLLGVRLRRAAARLHAGASVTEACFACGFSSLSHFVSMFRRHLGMRPSEARRLPGAQRRSAGIHPLRDG